MKEFTGTFRAIDGKWRQVGDMYQSLNGDVWQVTEDHGQAGKLLGQELRLQTSVRIWAYPLPKKARAVRRGKQQ